MSNKNIRFPGIKNGETFTVAGMEFIKFHDKDGTTPVVMRDIAFLNRFGDNNDLRESDVLDRMQKEILPKLVEELGEENVLTYRTDLTALDGLKPYEDLESQISLCPRDFYRENVEIFDRYPVGEWWWLANPESAPPHENPWWVLCVSPSGFVFRIRNYDNNGVRPFCIFNSSIFGSCED